MTTNSTTADTGQRPHRDYYTALYQAALTISSSLELTQVLQGIVQSTAEAMSVKGCGLRLLDINGQLRLSGAYGLSGSYLAKGAVRIEQSPIDSEALDGNYVYVADARTDARFQYKEAAKEEGIVSVLCVPLEVRGEAVGVMRVYTNTPTQFSDEDIKFLSALASLAALAIENARLYENIKSSYDGMMAALWGINS